MHTVFINDKPFRFVDVYEADQWKGNTPSIFIAEKEMSIEEAIEELEENKQHPGFIYLTSNPEVAWQQFISYCTLIEAAGGLVMNEKKEYLVIFRKGKYDLPKGKLDYDETPEQAAVREVQEECGISKPEITGTLEKTFHTYFQGKKRMLKKTHWFLMNTNTQELIPQEEEDIEKAVWMSAGEISSTFLKNTYASIGELIRKSVML